MTKLQQNADIAPPEQLDTAPSPKWETLRLFLTNPNGIAGLSLYLLILCSTIIGPLVYPVDPFDLAGAPFSPPDASYLFGTDYLGRDVLAGILVGGRATLAVGAVAALISVCIGMSIGSLSGYFGGKIDAGLMKITEFFQVLPTLLFAMVLVTIYGPSLITITIAIGVVSWTGVARLTRAEFMRIRELEYVKSVTASGGTTLYIILRVILPNALPPIIVAAAFAIGSAILFEGGLSFLGLGDPNRMSWGLIIGQGRIYVLDAWWPVVIPGPAIFLAVLSICLIGDGFNDALNPQLRKR
jgi:peptide/nickel transport system permease protein